MPQILICGQIVKTAVSLSLSHVQQNAEIGIFDSEKDNGPESASATKTLGHENYV